MVDFNRALTKVPECLFVAIQTLPLKARHNRPQLSVLDRSHCEHSTRESGAGNINNNISRILEQHAESSPVSTCFLEARVNLGTAYHTFVSNVPRRCRVNMFEFVNCRQSAIIICLPVHLNDYCS